MRTPHRSSGFSLIELLVVISIIAVLISILLPALAGARTASRELASLSNVRSLGQTFQLYHDQYKSFPFIRGGVKPEGFDAPSAPGVYFIRWYPEGTIIGTNRVWSMSLLWPGLVANIAPWTEHIKSWISPGRPAVLPEGAINLEDENVADVSYRYSNSFLGHPRLWKPGGPGSIVDDTLIRAVTASDVEFPAGKVILWDADLAYIRKEPERVGAHFNAKTPMAFVDGHAALKNPTEALQGVANPLDGGKDTRLHNTADGVQGRDYN